MSDSLNHGTRFFLFNIIDDSNRESVWITIDTSLPSSRLVRVFEDIKQKRPPPDVIRVNNCPEFLGE